MPIHGSIEEAGLPDVLQLLALGRKSGCLSVADGTSHGEIFLDVGRINFATVANRDRLGEILVKNGRITRDQLNEATAEQSRRSDRQLGRILLASGSVDRSEIEKVVRQQVEEAVYTLFTWKQGSFTFATDQRPARGALLVSLDAESLLLEGARRVDEWGQIQKKIPSFDLVYQRTKLRTSGEIGEDITDDQKRVLQLLDGTRELSSIVDATGMSEFDVGKALYGLIVAGFARLVERRAQIRHLDYRELLAYVVREAELADPQRRKMAARHIVDCPACSERLRTIHVRRTEGQPVVTPAEEARMVAEAQAETAAVRQSEAVARPAIAPEPEVAEAPVAMPEPEHLELAPPAVSDRRAGDRRAGRDRRQLDRRTPVDRRQVAAPARSPERRNLGRRQSDRGQFSDRRVADRGGRAYAGGGGGGSAIAAVAAAGHTQPVAIMRPTEARRIQAAALRERNMPKPAAAEAVVEVQPVAIDIEESAQLTLVPPPVEAPAAPPAAAVAPPPVAAPPPDAPAQKGDIAWIVSPRESIEFSRESHAKLRAADVAAGVPPATATPAPRPSPATVVPIIVSPPPARSPSATTTEVPAFISSPNAPRGRVAVQPPRHARSDAFAITLTLPKKNLLYAAAIAGVALLGYAAGKLGNGDGAGQGLEATSLNSQSAESARVPAATPPVATPPAAPAQHAPVTQPVERQPALAANPAPAPAGAATNRPVQTNQPTNRPAPSNQPATQPVNQRPLPNNPVVTAPAPGNTAAAPPPQPPPQPTAPAVAAPANPAPAPATATPTPAPAPVVTAPAVAPSEPDRELAAGGWAGVDRAEAITFMGGSIGVIQGLGVESIAKSLTGTRPRARVVQVAPSGERVVLTETRSGATRAPGAANITAIRVMPPSEAYPFSTGTVSLGNLLITAKSSMGADALRALLERLADVQ